MSTENFSINDHFMGLPLSEESMQDYQKAIDNLIPPQIIAQAKQIVADHRPEGILFGEEPVCWLD